jgi:hypothetical protein
MLQAATTARERIAAPSPERPTSLAHGRVSACWLGWRLACAFTCCTTWSRLQLAGSISAVLGAGSYGLRKAGLAPMPRPSASES